MNAAILCMGESVRAFEPDDFEGLLVAVNRAATKFRVDVWACGDIDLHTSIDKVPEHVIGSPELLTAAVTAAYLRDHGTPWRANVVEFESLRDYLDYAQLSWTLFTATAAIVYAASRGATRIDCYGMDWKGEADFDGWAKAGNRSPERWRLESGVFGAVVKTLAGMGVEVRRVTALDENENPGRSSTKSLQLTG